MGLNLSKIFRGEGLRAALHDGREIGRMASRALSSGGRRDVSEAARFMLGRGAQDISLDQIRALVRSPFSHARTVRDIGEAGMHRPWAIFDLDETLTFRNLAKEAALPADYESTSLRSWIKYSKTLRHDVPDPEMVGRFRELQKTHNVGILTARSERNRPVTARWLEKHGLNPDVLMMRPVGPKFEAMPSGPYKSAMLDKYLPNAQINHFFDDSSSVVKAMQERGINITAVTPKLASPQMPGTSIPTLPQFAEQLELFQGNQYANQGLTKMPEIFHGSKEGISRLGFYTQATGNLAGSGLYGTTGRAVAGSYGSGARGIAAASTMDVKNLYRINTPEYMKVLNIEEPLRSWDQPGGPELLEYFRRSEQHIPSTMENVSETALAKSLFQMGMDSGEPRPIISGLKGTDRVSQRMMQDVFSQSFDALEYNGGARVGGFGEHRAFNIIRPDKIDLEPLVGGIRTGGVPRSFAEPAAEQLAFNVDQMALDIGPQRHIPVRDLAPARRHSTARTGRMPTLSSSLRRLQDLGEQLNIYSAVPFSTYVGRPRM